MKYAPDDVYYAETSCIYMSYGGYSQFSGLLSKLSIWCANPPSCTILWQKLNVENDGEHETRERYHIYDKFSIYSGMNKK